METQERANTGLHCHIADVFPRSGLARDARILDLGCGTEVFLARQRAAGFTRL